MLDMDPYVIDCMYLTVCRAGLSEALAGIPNKEQPEKDDLIGYEAIYPNEEDLAWVPELFGPLNAWLSDRQIKQKNKDREDDSLPSDRPGQGVDRFNYQAGQQK